jgi:DNA-binding transcriptional ArsR family regulator
VFEAMIQRHRQSEMIRFHLPADAVERVAFAYSPLFECVLSLHVLVEPGHHSLQHEWVRRMRDLPDRARRDVRTFAFAYRSYIPQVLAPVGGFGSFEEEVARLLAQPPEMLAFEFTVPLAPAGAARDGGRLADAATRDEVARHGAALGRETGRVVRLLLEEPAAFAARFAEFLERYWQAGFANEWQRVEPLLIDAVSAAGRQLAADGLYGFLPRLSPELLVDAAAETIAIDRRHDHEVEVDEHSTLTLTPSVYVWPHVRVNCDAPWPLAIAYPPPAVARLGRPQLPPEDLVCVLRALADPTRLELLRLIAARPRSTQELAPLVGVTEAGASRSLRLLGEAGLVTTRRHGRYLLYHLAPERLDLSSTLERFIARDVGARRGHETVR